MMMMHKMYADVIIPLKFRDSVTYSVPEGMEGKIVPGSIVRVTVVGRSYSAIVIRLMQTPPIDPARIKPLQEIVAFPPVSGENMEFLRQVASYYMCSVGDAFRFAAPSTVKAVKKPGKSTGTGDTASEKKAGPLPVLSPEQAAAAGSIRAHFDAGRNVLLHGVTGSGKTEIYITLAAECLSRGLNVLYLVPEIALSRQIQSRLAACFGDGLMVYHSKQTAAHRREVYSRIAENARPAILLGLRSALFLPFSPIFSPNFRSSANFPIASPNSSQFAHKNPVSPETTDSRGPPLSCAITARLSAMASMGTIPKCSLHGV